VLHRTYIQLHIYIYKSVIIYTLHPKSSLHFTSSHFSTIHYPFFFTSLSFWTFRHHLSKTLHFSLMCIITVLTLFLKICVLQFASACADKPVVLTICIRLKKSNKMQQYADIYLLLNYSTCFGRPSRPSSGAHKTVVAASGTDHTIWGTSFFKRAVWHV